MTTPAAWTDACREMPSRRRAIASSSLTFGSFCSSSLSAGALLQRLVERHVERRRDELGDPVGLGERHVQHARHVPDHRLRLHRAEGDDLRDVLAAVLARHVLDDLAAPPLAEVDVDVGQRHALGVQEALEDEVELDRVDVGDAQAVRDEAAGGRPAPRPDRDALLPRVPDEVPDDQEVARVLHPLDHLDLVREPRRRSPRACASARPAPRVRATGAGAARSPGAPRARSSSSSVKPDGTSNLGR